MKGAAIRSRALELSRHLAAARHGRELLDQKREALQRELSARLATRAARRASAVDALAHARALAGAARVEVGRRNLAAAAIAQSPALAVTRATTSLAGVPLPRLIVQRRPLRLQYTLADSAPSVDRAAHAFAEALETLIPYAQEDAAVRHLQRGLARTTRRLNALDLLVIPEIGRELREVSAALDEEERDETLRRKRWLAAHADQKGAWHPS